MDGAIVLRSADAWNRSDHPLHARVEPILLRNLRSRNALSIITALLGSPQYRDVQLGDTKRFSLQFAGARCSTCSAPVDSTGRTLASTRYWRFRGVLHVYGHRRIKYTS
jgi:hypothetical protein